MGSFQLENTTLLKLIMHRLFLSSNSVETPKTCISIPDIHHLFLCFWVTWLLALLLVTKGKPRTFKGHFPGCEVLSSIGILRTPWHLWTNFLGTTTIQ